MSGSFDYIAFLLVLVYLVLLVLQSKQLASAFHLRNRIVNYRNGIMFLMACSSFLRVVFWTKVVVPSEAPRTLFMVFFYLPVWLNFASLSLLSVFYANAVYSNCYGSWPWRVCVALNVVFLALNVTIACLVQQGANDLPRHNSVYALYVAYAVFLDALTALLVGYFGFRFVALHGGKGRQLQLPRSVEEFSAVNWVLVLCYVSRSVFVAVLSSGLVSSASSVEVEFNGQHRRTSLGLCLFFLLTEALPALCMLHLLWKARGKEEYKALPLRTSVSELDVSLIALFMGDEGGQAAGGRQASIEDSVIKVFYSDMHYEEEALEYEEDLGEGLLPDFNPISAGAEKEGAGGRRENWEENPLHTKSIDKINIAHTPGRKSNQLSSYDGRHQSLDINYHSDL